MIRAQATSGRDAKYLEAVAFDYDIGRTRGIDAALKNHNLDALVLPSVGSSYTPAGKSPPHRYKRGYITKYS